MGTVQRHLSNNEGPVCFCLGPSCHPSPRLETEWAAFKNKFEKNFLSATHHDERKAVFAKNLALIEKHNAEHKAGKHSYWLGVNQFADLTNDEFVDLHTGFRSVEGMETADLSNVKAPLTMDWRDNGNPYVALQYIMQEGGVDTEDSYPYEMAKSYCRYSANNLGASISGAKRINFGDEGDLERAVAMVPVSVAIDASHYSFQLYSGGVYDEPYCSSYSLDHGVLAVGYGSEAGKDYWIVKNSWGPVWGEAGYIKMSKGRNNQCGIATMACYAEA